MSALKSMEANEAAARFEMTLPKLLLAKK